MHMYGRMLLCVLCVQFHECMYVPKCTLSVCAYASTVSVCCCLVAVHVLGLFEVLCCTQEDSHSATASGHAVVQEQTATDRVACSWPGLSCMYFHFI